eukprot:7758264-Pyramimonas_sp.AAC.1
MRCTRAGMRREFPNNPLPTALYAGLARARAAARACHSQFKTTGAPTTLKHIYPNNHGICASVDPKRSKHMLHYGCV